MLTLIHGCDSLSPYACTEESGPSPFESGTDQRLRRDRIGGNNKVDPLEKYQASADVRYFLGRDLWPDSEEDDVPAKPSPVSAPENQELGMRGVSSDPSDPHGD
ncbi:hypothetical protein HY285_04960 [Candidatus Peregrinibacteria bacterium]|nr:hypothetical protein [Candidatus Peregrinibacteria bacterium]MBI3816861.1 hypothetical protein [Candidatus Peregrinibacteria bacterium]